jgi:hypothetical protein
MQNAVMGSVGHSPSGKHSPQPAGVVYVVWDDNAHIRARHPDLADEFPDRYHCSLQPLGANSDPLADGPATATLAEALEWARRQSPEYILVRPEWDPGQHYVATDGAPNTWKRSDEVFTRVEVDFEHDGDCGVRSTDASGSTVVCIRDTGHDAPHVATRDNRVVAMWT